MNPEGILCYKNAAMAAIKSNYRKRIQLVSDLRVAISTIQLRLSHLLSNMQAHPSSWIKTFSHFCTLFVWLVWRRVSVVGVWLTQAKIAWFYWEVMGNMKQQTYFEIIINAIYIFCITLVVPKKDFWTNVLELNLVKARILSYIKNRSSGGFKWKRWVYIKINLGKIEWCELIQLALNGVSWWFLA